MPTLETLPNEILFDILSFTSPFGNIHVANLSRVAGTSKHLRQVVEEYSRVLLIQHASYNPKSIPAFTYRKKWISWVRSTCQLCKAKSKRRAILDRGTTCCNKCDRKIPKMTMTEVITCQYLSKLDLFTPNPLHPNLPPLTWGVHVVGGSDTMMLSTPDVLKRKSLIRVMLGDNYVGETWLRKRSLNHDRILQAWDLTFRSGRWIQAGRIPDTPLEDGPQRLRTLETREAYIREQLRKERELLGLEESLDEDSLTEWSNRAYGRLFASKWTPL